MKQTVQAYLTQPLNELGRWLSLDWRYYFRGGVWMALAYAASLLAGFFTSMVLARYLSKEAYGRYSFVFTMMSLASITALPGLSTAITRSVARGYPRSMLDGTHESIKASLWGSLALLGATFYYYLLQRDPQWQMLLIGAMTFPIIYGLQAPPSYFIGQKRFGLSAAYWIASELVVAIVVVGVVFIHPSPTLLVLASVSASCLVNSAFFLKAYSEVRHTPSQHDSGLLSYGRHLTGITAIGTIANYLDRVLISLYLDFTALAVFNVAAIFPDIVKSMAKYIDPLVLPRFAGLTKQQVSQRVRRKLLPMLMINWLTVIIAVFLTPLMIHLAYPAYLESVRYARWLFISLAFIVPTLVINSALTSQQSTRQLYQANLIFAAVQIGSLIILVPTMGLLGAVLSRVISRFCLAAYYGHALYSLEKGHG